MEELQLNEDDKPFLGKGWSFPIRFNWDTKSVQMAAAEKDIEESLFILLNTVKNERIMRPDYGCNLMEMVYEEMNSSFENVMIDYIKNAITLYESRIEIELIQIQEANLDGIVYVELDYLIRATNSRRNLVFPFYLTQGTQIEDFEKIHQ